MNSDIFPGYSSNYGQILEPIAVTSWNHTVTESANTTKANDSATKAKAIETVITPLDGEFQPVFSLNQDLDFFESKYTYKNNSNSVPNAKSDDLISEFDSTFSLL